MPEPLDKLRERIAPLLAPIPGASPAGAAARFEPSYQAVANEVAKLDAPTGGDVSWKAVTTGAGGLLREKTKDVVLASFLAHALHVTEGLPGLGAGLLLVAELLDQYWDTAFPEVKRIKGRVNAVQWLTERSLVSLQGREAGAQDLEAATALDEAVKRFADVVRTRFADAAPAMGGLLDEGARLRAAAEAAQPPPPSAAPEPASASSPASAPAGGAPGGGPMPELPSGGPGAGEAGVDYLRNVGNALIGAANTMRGADPSDALPYRVLRTGLWLHLQATPAATGGKTTVPPPPEALRAQFGVLAGNQKWSALLEEVESALQQNRFWMDLHRLSAQALAGLGGSHARAREAVVAEVRAIVGRMPALPSLSFADGSPFADAQTKAWLEEEVAPKAAAGGGGEGEADAGAAESLADAKRQLAGGQVGEGLAALQALVATRPAGRARFRARLELAKACAGAGLLAVAKATYDALDREAVAHGLDGWEPALSAEVLKGLIAATRALSKDPRGTSEAINAQYQRLCGVDPAAAHEVWP